jgi:spore germination protein YaaH
LLDIAQHLRGVLLLDNVAAVWQNWLTLAPSLNNATSPLKTIRERTKTMAPNNKPREALIGKALMDDAFAQELIANPTEAIKKAGIKLPAADLKRIEALKPEERAQLVGQLQGASSALSAKAYLDNLKLI